MLNQKHQKSQDFTPTCEIFKSDASSGNSDRPLKEVKKENPCPHCGKDDWCYRIGELSACKRSSEPAQGWYKTERVDKEGTPYYAPVVEKKAVRPKQTRRWEYPARDGSPLVRITRIDDGKGSKPKRYQEHWDGFRWIKGLGDVPRIDIPIYRYQEIKQAIASGEKIFIVEGEPAADALWALGIAATTNIGGASKWQESDTQDLAGVAGVVLCPDRDKPGIKHMLAIAQIFPDAQWLPAFPESSVWDRLPDSGGLDVADWIADFQLTSSEVMKSVIDKEHWIERLERIYQAAPATKEKGFHAAIDENHFRDVAQKLGLPPENCCTVTAFDLWVLEQLFDLNDWRALDQSFYKWSDSFEYWKLQEDSDVIRSITIAGQNAYKLVRDKSLGWIVKRPYGTNSNKESAFKYIRSRLEVPSSDRVDNSHLLGFRNCVADLRTGQQYPHSREFYITNIIPYDYTPNSECPEVYRQFVTKSFGEDMLPVMRAFTSMFLDPTAPYGRFPHIIGQSGGGKGTQIRLWGAMFGSDGYGSANKFSDLSTPEGRHQYLTGKRIFAFPDMGGFADGIRAFYELVDNGSMTGRPLFSSTAYSKKWNIRFALASVDHLQIENAGDGWARRAYPILAISRNVETDPDLETKLRENLADIISWALAMPSDERDHILLSIPESDRSKSLAHDAAIYGDSTRSFVDLCLRPSLSNVHVPSHLLHSWYVSYCQQHGYTPLGQSKFISHLKTVLPRNFVDRKWGEMKNGKRDRIPAHWINLDIMPSAFKSFIPGVGDARYIDAEQIEDNTQWNCIKSKCVEGGISEFGDFWQGVHPIQSQILVDKINGQPENLTASDCPISPSSPIIDLSNGTNITVKTETPKTEIPVVSTKSENSNPNIANNSQLPSDNQDSPDTPSGRTVQPISDLSQVGGIDGQDRQNTPLLQLIVKVWDNIAVLGKLVLSSSEQELQATVINCTLQQINHIKNAANSVWQPGVNRDADYMGERVEIWEAGHGREISVKSRKGGGIFKVKRGNLRPWLGL
jgi:phage/plasmid-associated DNA primase